MTTIADFLESEWQIPRDMHPPNHYHLLGIAPFESDKKIIARAAQDRSTLLKEYQLRPEYALVVKKLNANVATAKLCLLNRQKKIDYDSKLAETPLGSIAINGAAQLPQNRVAEPADNGASEPDTLPGDKSHRQPGEQGEVPPRDTPAPNQTSRATSLPEPAPLNWQSAHHAPGEPHFSSKGQLGGVPVESKSDSLPNSGTQRYTPQMRPAVPWLYVMDDTQTYPCSEVLRLRKECYIIGRTNGDIRIEHDVLMSPVHVSLERVIAERLELGKPQDYWRLKDLNSDNGTYMYILDAALRDGDQLMWGSYRAKVQINADSQDLVLTVRAPFATKRVLTLQPGVHQLGRDPALCPLLSFPDDMLLEPQHAEFAYDIQKNLWSIHAYRSLNSVWLRLRGAKIIRSSRVSFQAGEQRFTFSTKPLHHPPAE